MTDTQYHHTVTDVFRDRAIPQLKKLFPELPPHLICAVVSSVTCISGSAFVSLNTHKGYLTEIKNILGVNSTNELRNIALTRLALYLLSMHEQ